MDCMEGMRTTPDKFYDLAVVDPEYGIGMDGQKLSICKNPKHNRKEHVRKDWDSEIPSPDYFKELMRVSKNQIIWGGNYFSQFLPPTKAWIFWYKGQRDLTMSDGEMAWTSFDTVTRQKELNRFELKKEGTIHPTQKPIAIYDWIYSKYLPGGGQSSRYSPRQRQQPHSRLQSGQHRLYGIRNRCRLLPRSGKAFQTVYLTNHFRF